MAAWPAILVDDKTEAVLLAARERVAEPKEASVTKREFRGKGEGRIAVPKRTAVPAGELWTSAVEIVPFMIGKTDRKPVSFFVGSPLTVVSRAELSALKKVCDTVLNGPLGGVDWPRQSGRRSPRDDRPVEDMAKQVMPAMAPPFATQACLRVRDIVTLTGNSPSVSTGLPTMVSFVGSTASMTNMETVLEPGLTASKVCEMYQHNVLSTHYND